MPKVKKPEPSKTEQSPEYILTMKLIAEFKQAWVDQMREAGVSQVLYSRLSVVALAQVASVVAVDIGMTAQQFGDLCVANYTQAHARAPRFS